MDDLHFEPTSSPMEAAPATVETHPTFRTLALGVAAPFGTLALLAVPALIQALIH
jgi:hypothetical protein